MSEAFDLWADENEPIVSLAFTTYRLSVPKPSEIKTNEIPFVYVQVDEYGMISIDDHYTLWFGDRLSSVDASKSLWELHKEIYSWLVEWELAEWKQIGPEDSELFATSKLVGYPGEERIV